MKITKFAHSCLLVEMPEPINRTALFDPGAMSQGVLDVAKLEFLDDIIITHKHQDHYNLSHITALLGKFPDVRITAPTEVVADLEENGITNASSEPSEGIELFNAPHENVEPLFPRPQQIGVHYLGMLTHPGDSHSFIESKEILALPVSGPWASTVTAVNVAIKLRPKIVIPIHDWHWSDMAREQMYAGMEAAFKKEGIEFVNIKTGIPEVFNT